MNNQNDTFERAMKLAVVCGLRAALGPALVASAQNHPDRRLLAMAAVGESLVDKLPLVPSRSSLPLLIPRAIAGGWVVKKMLEREGRRDDWAVPMGAAVAAGVATLAPMLRRAVRKTLGVPDFVVGLGEDYFAARLGSEAVGMTLEDVRHVAQEALGDVQAQVQPTLERYVPSLAGGTSQATGVS